MSRLGFRFAIVAVVALATQAMAQGAFSLPGRVAHEYQRLNNCGPVTVKMVLSLFGVSVTQAEAAAVLKTNRLDRNVSPPEFAAYLERFGLRSLRRYAGTPDGLRRLLRAGFPVVLHQQMTLRDDIGHYRLAYGFDAGGVVTADSFLGPRLRLPDADLETLWRPYAGEYLVVYRPNQTAALERALGPDAGREANLRRLEESARARTEAAPRDPYGWWGLGVARLRLGAPRGAAEAFLAAQRLGLPKRHYWYQQDALEAWNRVGWFDLARRVAARALGDYPRSPELGLAHARALESLGRDAEAHRALRAVLAEDPDNPEARAHRL